VQDFGIEQRLPVIWKIIDQALDLATPCGNNGFHIRERESTMETRLERELDELLGSLHVEVEPTSFPTEGISVVCLYHKADRRDWQRLEQHLEAVRWQFQRLNPCEMTWNSYECNPKKPTSELLMANATQAIDRAHIVLVGLSVDMQLFLQQTPGLSSILRSKLEQVRQTKSAWGQPPYVSDLTDESGGLKQSRC
jgi:hypothetical protein